ncbi:MAG: TIGR02270 family protein [Gammaproteobacteria bacterium]|nr:TIGR02270 family protein [Gammaproteobacteria bacterium]
MTSAQTRLLPYITQQYAEETAFLWLSRNSAQKALNYNAVDLSELENRLDANLEGLMLSGEAGWHICRENLDFEESGEVFAAATFAIENRDLEKLNQVFVVAAEYTELLDAIVDAFVWFPFEKVASVLESFLTHVSFAHRYVGISALTAHRQHTPELEQVLLKSLESEDVALTYKALLALGELGLSTYLAQIQQFLEHDDENIQFAASWSATRFGNSQGMENLKAFVAHPLYHEKALQYVVMQRDIKNTVDIIRQLLSDESTARLALIALGYLGNPKSIPQIIGFMKNPVLARIAGNAFSDITGIDLTEAKLDKDEPEGFEAGPSEDPEDEDVEMDPDEDLPWPDVEKITAWWANSENQARLSQSDRYLLGKPMSKEQLQNILRVGNQKQRAFVANCLGVYEKDQPIFNVYAPAKRQMQLLGL